MRSQMDQLVRENFSLCGRWVELPCSSTEVDSGVQ